MNIPVGKLVEKRVSFEETMPAEKVPGLMDKGFSGYIAATVEGGSGLEEALLLFREGEAVGACFEAITAGERFFGIAGLRLCLNLLAAGKGVFDVNSLTRQQVDLIIAFNDKVALKKPLERKTFSKLLPASYSPEIVSRVLKGVSGEKDAREKALKRFGLGSI